MDKIRFNTIGIVCKPNDKTVSKTLETVLQHLKSRKRTVILGEQTAIDLDAHSEKKLPITELAQVCQLLIVIGGDGSLLSAARHVAPYNTHLIGINRGSLGFLTDITPINLAEKLDAILNGQFIEEKRFLLEASVIKNNVSTKKLLALNEFVIMAKDSRRIIEVETYVNDKYMTVYLADGVVIATPTGSTGYSLSGGGPILSPDIDAFVIIPMFPQNLSSRPIVITGNKTITLKMPKMKSAHHDFHITSDSQVDMDFSAGCEIHLNKFKNPINLIHPINYDYFTTLREKLLWGIKPKNFIT